MKLISKGDLVRIRRSKWGPSTGEVGVVIERTYMAYEEKNSRWKILVGDSVKEVTSEYLYLVDPGNLSSG